MTPAGLGYRLGVLALGVVSLTVGALQFDSVIAFESGPFIGGLGSLVVLAILLLAPVPRTLIGVSLWVSLMLTCVLAAAFGLWWPLILFISPVWHGPVFMVAGVATHFMDEGMLPRWPRAEASSAPAAVNAT